MVSSSIRPASVTALTILQIIVGIIDLMFGFLIFLAFRDPSSFAFSFVGISSSYSFLMVPIAVAWFTFGVLALIVAGFIWKGKGWAWFLAFILATDALVLGGFVGLLGSLSVALPLAVYGLILIFLSLTRVRVFCGRTYMPGPFIFAPIAAPRVETQPALMAGYPQTQFAAVAQPYAPQAFARFPQPTWTSCPSCGSALQAGTTFCGRCGMRFR